ncbi:hypothetical protein HELRODRAFT_172732 [Helobdella robusta]|uniref:Uncharacterized protein n=1 Tax=Helobdella robusta TaxID=6412 RepID=T1F5V7_HELRO|nr:hypothetical protein HELRODRAFT_172732 [Helobdella robusta]ESO04367.1 hypothetical protein HELRODRAFT_172732 [Helobdella robusta]
METLLPVEFNRQQIKDYQSYSSSSFIQNHKSQPHSVNNNNDNEINLFPSSNTSTLSANSSLVGIDKNGENNGESLEGNGDVKGIFVSGSWLAEMVRLVLYATRENVNIVHEVFKQAFLQYHHESYNATRRVINDVTVPPDDVKVGLQNSLRFFFNISSNVFMVSFSPSPVVDSNEVIRQLDSQGTIVNGFVENNQSCYVSGLPSKHISQSAFGTIV